MDDKKLVRERGDSLAVLFLLCHPRPRATTGPSLAPDSQTSALLASVWKQMKINETNGVASDKLRSHVAADSYAYVIAIAWRTACRFFVGLVLCEDRNATVLVHTGTNLMYEWCRLFPSNVL